MSQPEQQLGCCDASANSDICSLQPEEFPVRFKILSKLGSGAFADVYRVRDNSNNTDLALKVLKPSAPRIKGLKPEVGLFREARALKYAKHTNIVGLVDILKVPLITNCKSSVPTPPQKHCSKTAASTGVGSSNKGGGSRQSSQHGYRWGLLLDYAQCGSLSAMVLKQMIHPQLRVYTDVQALTWAVDIATGLEHLHGLKPLIIHRDLKLENILLQKPSADVSSSSSRKLPVAKISDMGLHVMVDKQKTPFMLSTEAGRQEQQQQVEDGKQQQHAGNLSSSSGGSDTGPYSDQLCSSSSSRRQAAADPFSMRQPEAGQSAAAAARILAPAAIPDPAAPHAVPALAGNKPSSKREAVLLAKQQQLQEPEQQISSLYIGVAAAASGSNGSSTDAAVEISIATDAADTKVRPSQEQQQQHVAGSGMLDSHQHSNHAVVPLSTDVVPASPCARHIPNSKHNKSADVGSSSSTKDGLLAAAKTQNAILKDYQEPTRPKLLNNDAAGGCPSARLAYDLTRHTGSCMYMAPEVYKGKLYNESVDVFSLGVMVYELFSRTLLLYTHTLANSPSDSMRYAKRVSEGYRPKCPKNFSKDVWHIIERCWSHDAAARPSAAWVRQQLQQLLAAEESATAAAPTFGGLRGLLQRSRGKRTLPKQQTVVEDDKAASAPDITTAVISRGSSSSTVAGKGESSKSGPAVVTAGSTTAVAAAGVTNPGEDVAGTATFTGSDWTTEGALCGCIIC